MTPASAHFAPNYAQARQKFRAAAVARGLLVASHVHPEKRGPDNEELAIDFALLGEAASPHLLLISSGMHGVEGFAGSGVQVGLLHDDAFAALVKQTHAAVLFCHALNPYGFAHLRRTNENNVDLNRNFRDFSTPPEPHAAYAEVHDMVVPRHWPPTPENQAQIGAYVMRHGMKAVQAAVSGGQCEFPNGLFYGGVRPTWSNSVLRAELRAQKARRRLGWIDLHTGLGPWGHGEKIYAGIDEATMLARARAWFGADVTTFFDGSSSSAALSGVGYNAVVDECPGVEYTGVGLEFGTVAFETVFHALRADQWLENHPTEAGGQRAQIKRQIRDAFYVDDDEWKAMVYGQARVAALQALHGLSSGPTFGG